MASQKMVTAVFRDPVNVRAVYEYICARGYRDDEVNLLMSDKTRAEYYAHTPEGKHTTGTHATEGMGVGGAVGTIAGSGLAAIAAVGTTLAIPGLGLVIAGPVAAALAGAVAGGVVGGLVGLGIPEENAEAYHAALREGGVVIGVEPRDNNEARELRETFEKHGGENIVTIS